MKRVALAIFCGLTAICLTVAGSHPQGNGKTEITMEKLVGVIRTLNTAEYSYQYETGRFAHREEMLNFLRTKGDLSRLPIELENPEPYALAITTSTDGLHYQITLQRPSNMNDKTTWCKTALFSDDRGVIFLGSALGCQATAR
jgi:hypothetical protein